MLFSSSSSSWLLLLGALLHPVIAIDLDQTQQLMMSMHPCAQGCILSATTASCGSVTDLTCSVSTLYIATSANPLLTRCAQCGLKLEEITGGALPCMLQQCRKDDITAATNIIGQICTLVAMAANPSTANSTSNSTDISSTGAPPAIPENASIRHRLGGMGLVALTAWGVVALI